MWSYTSTPPYVLLAYCIIKHRGNFRILHVVLCGCKTWSVTLREKHSSRLLSGSMKIKIHISIVFPILYECGTWSLILRRERRLGVCENRVLRRIFGA
jgi:hypothetical protein